MWQKSIISWKVGHTLYLSVPFTWLLDKARFLAIGHKGPVLVGGPAIKLLACDWAETSDVCDYDVLSFYNPLATFTTRGCLRSCSFCAVPKIEGEFRELNSWKPNPIICDNNILAASKKHFKKVIDRVRIFPYVDFNQGLDARLFTPWHADQLARLRAVKIRFAFDHVNMESGVGDAIQLCRKFHLKDLGVYILIGFQDNPEDAHYRLETVRSWGIRPNPMRYQPLDALQKNDYVAPGWTEKELRKTMKYYARLRWYEHIPYGDFDYLTATTEYQGSLF